MNTSTYKTKPRFFPVLEASLEDHLEHEHDTIRKELRHLVNIVCSESKARNTDSEIEFRNRLIWVSRTLKAHMTSEERVVFKRAYGFLTPHEQDRIEKLCDINGSIDMVLDDLENRSWVHLEAIRLKVMLLIELFESHVRYEDEGLLGSLKNIPHCSHRSLIRQLVHTETAFLNWMNEIENTSLPV